MAEPRQPVHEQDIKKFLTTLLDDPKPPIVKLPYAFTYETERKREAGYVNRAPSMSPIYIIGVIYMYH